MRQLTFSLWSGPALLVTLALGGAAMAATSFSNPLTGFTGNSTQVPTQTAVSAAGFNFFTTEGFTVDNTVDPPVERDPTIDFDATGALFGNLLPGDGGRNYMRTNDADYANVRFVAEVTVVVSDLGRQAHYFGLGSGDAAAFRTPDWTTPVSSVMYWGEVDVANPFLTTLKNRDGFGSFVSIPAEGLDSGTHRCAGKRQFWGRVPFDRSKSDRCLAVHRDPDDR